MFIVMLRGVIVNAFTIFLLMVVMILNVYANIRLKSMTLYRKNVREVLVRDVMRDFKVHGVVVVD